eukprot:5567810-Lingulodinium_polyedra.AAC.1
MVCTRRCRPRPARHSRRIGRPGVRRVRSALVASVAVLDGGTELHYPVCGPCQEAVVEVLV